jgi:hypothetical protein
MHAGEIRMGGETVRWIDLPAAKLGCPDVFDRAPSFNSQAERTAWFAQQCAAIRAGCRRHHGKAHWHFIENVIRQRGAIRGELVKLRDAFAKQVIQGENDHVVQHLAKTFGHIYAAGVLAVRFGTVPWSEDLVLDCVRRCYRAARVAMRTEADLLRRGLRRLRVRAKSSSIVSVGDQAFSRRRLGAADGYRGKGLACNRITVRAEAFKSWFDDPRQPKLVLELLSSKRCLPNRPKPAKGGQGIVWAESQPQWPDGRRRRSIVIDVKPKVLKKAC